MLVRLKPYLIVFLLLATVKAANAQNKGSDTVMKGSTIEVIQAYKPQVKKAPKPEWMPQLPKTDTTHPIFNYEVPQQTLYYSYSADPIKPMALGIASNTLPYQSYVRAGAGNLSTFFVDAGVGGLNTTNSQTSISLQHLSQKGPIKHQQTSLSSIATYSTLSTKQFLWHGQVQLERNRYGFYGYNHDQFEFSDDASKQVYSLLRGTVGLTNKQLIKGLSFKPSLDFSRYSSRGNNELALGWDIPVAKALDSNITFIASFSGVLGRVAWDGGNTSNNLIQLKPGIRLVKNALTGVASIGFAAGKDGNAYILPDIDANFAIREHLTIGGGWLASVRRNTLQSLTQQNPYLIDLSSQTQGRTDELYGKASAQIGTHVMASARIAWWSLTNMPIFYNTDLGFRKFVAAYQDANAVNASVALKYLLSEQWSLSGSATYYGYYNFKTPYLWHQPSLIANGEVAYQPISKLQLNGAVHLMNGIRALRENGTSTTLTVLDVSLRGNYSITDRLSAFLHVNNLLNNKYQRWYGYDAYGFNIFGGVALKF